MASPELMSFKPQRGLSAAGGCLLRRGGVSIRAEFVWKVLEQFYKDGTKQPVDFIFERAAGGRSKIPRQRLVRHNGRVSSQPSRVLRWVKD